MAHAEISPSECRKCGPLPVMRGTSRWVYSNVMTSLGRRFPMVVGAVTLVGAIATGCGSSESSPPTTKSVAATTTSTGPSTPTTTRAPAVPPTTGSPAVTAPNTSSQCPTSSLAVTAQPNQGVSGTFILYLVFTNIGRVTCTLRGYPGASIVGTDGAQLGAAALRMGAASSEPTVSLAPGQITSAGFTYPAGPGLECPNPISAQGVRVYPPNQTAALFAPATSIQFCSSEPAPSIYPIGVPNVP